MIESPFLFLYHLKTTKQQNKQKHNIPKKYTPATVGKTPALCANSKPHSVPEIPARPANVMERMKFMAIRNLSARVRVGRLRTLSMFRRSRVRPEARKKYVNYWEGRGLVLGLDWGYIGLGV